MTTLQELLNQEYPTKEDKNNANWINLNSKDFKQKPNGELERAELDLNVFPILEWFLVYPYWCNIKSVNLNNCFHLTHLVLSDSNITSVDFLNQIPNPEKLIELDLSNNRIEPTDIKIFSRFVNLYTLKIGNWHCNLGDDNGRNKFYGSFESLKNLTNLQEIGIEATDIDKGLEFLPPSLYNPENKEYWKKVERNYIACSPCFQDKAKCKVIDDELKPLNYDLEAWQKRRKGEENKAEQEQRTFNKLTGKAVGEELNRLKLENERMKNQNDFLKEQLGYYQEQPPK